ncbi:MAG TPA: LL-diaminopimelate aminotransferase [bacterium]|nr:LL-diaminopimelate aminotransferase [bacterium]
MEFPQAERLKKLPPYLFIEMDKKKKAAIEKGVDIISLAIGDPDLATPDFIIEALYKAAKDKVNHQYPLGSGLPKFREAVAKWYKRRFQVDLDPKDEVVALIGSKEGIGHLPIGILDPGDVVLMPSPGYPVYHAGTLFAGGESYFMPLLEKNGFLPDLDAIPADVLKRAKLIWTNSPNNPTSVLMDKAFYEKTLAFAQKHGLIVANDAAYTELYYDGKRPVSFLEVPGSKEMGVEFHSLSKTFNMTGWRVGFAVGNKSVLKALAEVKGNLDSGVFNPIQYAGIAALEAPEAVTDGIRKIYQERRDLMAAGLKKLGWQFQVPQAAFYFWIKVPNGMSSADWCGKVLEESGIVVTPGNGFGKEGEGYFRATITAEKHRLEEALQRLSKLK